jgi:hypothetical protein
VCQVVLAGGLTIEELHYKYPSCCTCASRVMRVTRKKRGKAGQMAWCELHNRPVEYHWYVDGKKRYPIGDVPCEAYTYERKPSLF